MKINRQTDIIRTNCSDYINVDSKNRLIAQLIRSSAENVYGFNARFGKMVDQDTRKEMRNTYWISSSKITEIDESVEVAVL